MKRLCEIFDIWYGVNLEVVNCEETTEKEGIAFVSRTSANNGISTYVKIIDDIEPNPANTISVACSGSVLSSFYHSYPYYSGRDVYILQPKEQFSDIKMLFYCASIEHNKYRYNYGRQANKTLDDIPVPAVEDLPKYLENYKTDCPFEAGSVLNKKIEFNISELVPFALNKIFNVERGMRLTKEDREAGNIPLITAGFNNQGVAEYISNEEMKVYNDKITIDMFGNCFYRNYDFCCDDNILVLNCKVKKLSRYESIFISTIINKDAYRNAYGRQYRQKTFAQHRIKLPADINGNPNWQLMEEYIKSLPYSKAL